MTLLHVCCDLFSPRRLCASCVMSCVCCSSFPRVWSHTPAAVAIPHIGGSLQPLYHLGECSLLHRMGVPSPPSNLAKLFPHYMGRKQLFLRDIITWETLEFSEFFPDISLRNYKCLTSIYYNYVLHRTLY